jgi:hypothetical protein
VTQITASPPECAFNLTRLPGPDVPTSQKKMLPEKQPFYEKW